MKRIKRISIIAGATVTAIATLNVVSETIWEPIRVAVENIAPSGVVGATINVLLPMLVWLAVAALIGLLAFLADRHFNS